MTLKVADLNGTHLHYADQGRQDAPVLVFSNSLGTDLRIWDDVVAIFAPTFRVITYDKRGHGLSGIGDEPYSIDLHTRDLVALLDHLGVHSAIVCGLSVGGLIAQHLAAIAPARVRGLILCDTAPKIGDATGWNARIDAITKGGMDVIGDAVIERWLSENYRTGHPAMSALYRAMLVRTPVAGYGGTCAALRDADLTTTTSALTIPVLCVGGSVDQSTPPELVRAMADGIPGAGFALIDGVGHLPPIEAPQELCRLIDGFIKENSLV
ncbi:3-oxoadipate enol-lactonase [uncultured Thalassospira sp.]|jgi:3-oxoadipate enol-lactonase|uniref:3-oxoadipate enol-lactonase n=1 Tax=uncultured Thalassospira sp. TaxID=404382 RepID=UPI0030D76714|tara:strand:- start:15306 stop:16106 length:801 start_codon:yes stop_codon:yes gene_type:complete